MPLSDRVAGDITFYRQGPFDLPAVLEVPHAVTRHVVISVVGDRHEVLDVDGPAPVGPVHTVEGVEHHAGGLRFAADVVRGILGRDPRGGDGPRSSGFA